MNVVPDRQLFLEVQDKLGLPSPALVEKDWHVARALAAIHDVEVEGVRLVFGGGTSLGRAYGLLHRMSEDIDLRIVGPKANSRGALQRLRAAVNARLEAAGFAVEGNYTVKQNDRYVRYELPYAAEIGGEGVLRPWIKIELAAFPIVREPVERPVSSFVAEALGQPPEIAAIPCVSLVETSADKFVAVTRRVGYALGGFEELDWTLVRHLYDLTRVDGEYDAEDARAIALEVMRREAETRGADYLAYREDPLVETLRTVAAMASHTPLIADYDRLMAEMVYGDKPPFDAAMQALRSFAAGLEPPAGPDEQG